MGSQVCDSLMTPDMSTLVDREHGSLVGRCSANTLEIAGPRGRSPLRQRAHRLERLQTGLVDHRHIYASGAGVVTLRIWATW